MILPIAYIIAVGNAPAHAVRDFGCPNASKKITLYTPENKSHFKD